MQDPPKPQPQPQGTRTPSLGELFFAFMKVGLSGFGGVLAWAHRMVVDERRWLTEQEFIETLGLCQVVPGPNIGNVSIYLGTRFHGWRGAVAAFTGLMMIPFGLVLTAGALYARFGDLAAVRGALNGVSAASAGLLLSMAIRMAKAKRRDAVALLFAPLAFAGIALLDLPLLPVLAVLVPLSIAAAWARRT